MSNVFIRLATATPTDPIHLADIDTSAKVPGSYKKPTRLRSGPPRIAPRRPRDAVVLERRRLR